MSIIPRHAAGRLIRSSRINQIRTIQSTSSLSFADSTPPNTPKPESSETPAAKPSRFPFITPKKSLPSTPYTVTQAPQFPAPNDPFLQPSKPVVSPDGKTTVSVPVTRGPMDKGGENYSDTTKAVVRSVARLMGYNSKASTAIRETGRMMMGIVESIERDRVYWYDQCGLPPTYQTFFQLHLLYVLILLPRLRALAVTSPTTTTSEIPEPLEPSPPTHSQHRPTPTIADSTVSSSPSTPAGTSSILVKPDHDAYPSEILNHFFELAESEMRKVLGRGERERVVKKYMSEMGEQWKGAGAGLDYVMGLSLNDAGDKTAAAAAVGREGETKADIELASWVWRNLYASQGLTAGPIGPSSSADMGMEVEIVQRLEETVGFIRREMQRLDQIEDIDVLAGNIGEWGQAKSS